MAKIKTESSDGLQPLILDRSTNEAEQITKWANDYVKMPNTKDSKQFVIQKTAVSIFLAVLFRQDIILFEWACEPYLKFMKVKNFWLPENPRFMNLLHNGSQISELILGYSTEANIVDVVESKVKEVKVNQDFQDKAHSQSRACWKTFSQVPNDLDLADSSQSAKLTFGRKLVTTSLSRRQVLPANRTFLGTYSRFTQLLDIEGHEHVTTTWKDGLTWIEPPLNLVQRPGEYLFSVGKHSIECVDWTSGSLIQSLSFDESVNLRLLMDTPGSTLVIAEKRKLGSVLFLIQEKCSSIKFYDPLAAADKKLTTFKASGTSIQSSRFEISDLTSNDGSFTTSQSSSALPHINIQTPLQSAPKKESRFASVRKTLTRISEVSNNFKNDKSIPSKPSRLVNVSADDMLDDEQSRNERARRRTSFSMPRLSIGSKTIVNDLSNMSFK